MEQFRASGFGAVSSIVVPDLEIRFYFIAREYGESVKVDAVIERCSCRILVYVDTFGERLELTYNELKPEYMRMTEAEQRLREGTLGKGIAGKGNK